MKNIKDYAPEERRTSHEWWEEISEKEWWEERLEQLDYDHSMEEREGEDES